MRSRLCQLYCATGPVSIIAASFHYWLQRLMDAFKAAAEAVKEKSLPVEDRVAKWVRKWMKVGGWKGGWVGGRVGG